MHRSKIKKKSEKRREKFKRNEESISPKIQIP